MIRIRDISLAPGHTPEQLRAAAARALRLSPREILNLQIVRRSLDARNQERIRWIYAVDVTVDGREELAIRRAGGVDILLTHAPPRGYGDREDYAHRGFEAFLPFLDRHKPAYLVHGHVHMNYGHNIPRAVKRGDTTIINAWERYILEL